MPDIQINGTLNVAGRVFIPSGTTTSKVIPRVTSTDNATVRFNGTTGDVQDSLVTIGDVGNITSPSDVNGLRLLSTTTGTSTIMLRNLSGYNRLDSYNNPITATYPLLLNASNMQFQIADSTKMTLDANGNIGIGVSPSPWNGYKGIDMASNASVASYLTNITLNSNTYFGSGGWTYKSTAPAGQYMISNNVHTWNIAASGTAGNTASVTTAMTLDGLGNVGIGIGPSAKLDVCAANNGIAGKILRAGLLGIADGLVVEKDAVANMTLSYVNQSAVAFKIPSSGNLLIGTTTDTGVNKLQVNGGISSKSRAFGVSDLNSLYSYSETVIVDNATLNIPINDYGYVTIVTNDGNYAMQQFVPLNPPARLFIRVKAVGGGWSPWLEK